jgi:hypothetical protein
MDIPAATDPGQCVHTVRGSEPLISHEDEAECPDFLALAHLLSFLSKEVFSKVIDKGCVDEETI